MTDTHERCSELLAPFLRNELEADDARFVEEHLASCEECRAERRALDALMAPIDSPLTELERSRLHRETWKEIEGDIEPVREPLMARLAPYLGAAAVLVIIAVGIVVYSGGGGDEDMEGAGDGGGAVTLEDAGAPEGADAGGGAADSGVANESLMAAPSPLFEQRAGAFDVQRLDELGASGYPFPDFKAAYVEETSIADREQAARDLDTLGQLVSAAGKRGGLVRRCASNAVQLRPGSIPAYGGLGTFRGRKVLVIGLVLGENGQDAGHYSIWVYRRGDCSVPLDVREGPINPSGS